MNNVKQDFYGETLSTNGDVLNNLRVAQILGTALSMYGLTFFLAEAAN